LGQLPAVRCYLLLLEPEVNSGSKKTKGILTSIRARARR
jgi:hypothetical protein